MHREILKTIFYNCNSLLKKYDYRFTKFYQNSLLQSGGGLEVTYKSQKVKFYKIVDDGITTLFLSGKNKNNKCVTIIIHEYDQNAEIREISTNPYKPCQLPKILNKGSSYLDITMKLLTKYKDKFGIKTIYITDNSFIYCNGINISLAELSFLQYGSTFYGRWGFKPKLKQHRKDYKASQKKIFNFKVKNINLEKFIYKKYKKDISKRIYKILKNYDSYKEDLFVIWFKKISKKYLKKECYFFNKLLKYIIRRFELDIFPRHTFIKKL